jgi:hypothetical protein
VHDGRDVARVRRARAVVHLRLARARVRGVASLQHVQRAPHVPACELEQRRAAVGCDVHPEVHASVEGMVGGPGRRHILFGGDDALHTTRDFRLGERAEAETRAAALDGGCDLADVVADDAEADVARVLLDDTPERSLCGLCHRVCLIEYDELEAAREERARLREVLDLQAHDVDTTVVGRVQLRGL